MNPSNNIEEQLWNYLDGNLPAGEKTVIENLVETNAAWKAKYRELVELQSFLVSTELESPSMRFQKNVMEEISKLHIAPATKSYINKKLIWGIGFFFVALLTGFLIYGIAQTGGSSTGDSQIAKTFDKIDLSRMFNNNWVNAFMMINVILGLVILDHYLGGKRKAFRKQH